MMNDTARYFKDYTGESRNTLPYYCGKIECITCKHSYGEVKLGQKEQHMFCKRPKDVCEYEPLARVVLKHIVDVDYNKGKAQFIVEEE